MPRLREPRLQVIVGSEYIAANSWASRRRPMIDETSELELKILREPSRLGCKPRSKIIKRGKHGERSVDQLPDIIEPGLGASRFDDFQDQRGR